MFSNDVKRLISVFEEVGNPFADTSKDLYRLDTKQSMPDNVKAAVESAKDIGIVQFQNFVSERIHGNTTAFNDVIRKNNLPLFNYSSGKKSGKASAKISNLANDVSLFSRLYIACQTRDSDMDAFFAHENHPWPPSLATNGIMNTTTKSDLIECLESITPALESPPTIDVKILDGACLVHTLDPKYNRTQKTVKTFKDFSDIMFIPCIERMLQNVVRIDIVWDVYKEDSLKAQMRERRGSGSQIRVENDTKFPTN